MMSQNVMHGEKSPKHCSRNMPVKPRQLDLLNQAKNMDQIRPKSRGQIRPKSKGQIRPKSKGQIRPKTWAKTGQNHRPSKATAHGLNQAKNTGQKKFK